LLFFFGMTSIPRVELERDTTSLRITSKLLNMCSRYFMSCSFHRCSVGFQYAFCHCKRCHWYSLLHSFYLFAKLTRRIGMSGSAIVRLLQENGSYNKIYSVSRGNSGYKHSRIQHTSLDLQRSAETMAKDRYGVSAEYIWAFTSVLT
jgi:hypothetical protein